MSQAPDQPAAAALERVERPIQPAPPHGDGWIVSPLFDLFFIANLGWLLLLAPGMSLGSETTVDFWRIYFLTLPHRWITLFLIVLDPEKRDGRGLRLVLVGVALLLVVVGVWIGTEALTCLAVIDYVWNSWHFAAQHAGVLRIYSRKVGGGSQPLERHGLRFFITYAILRTAGWTTGWLESSPTSFAWLRAADLAVLAVPAMLLVSTALDFRSNRLGKSVYLLSVCSLYSGLILALSYRSTGWVVVLAAASGMFHAVEYLAIVTHYAWRRQNQGAPGVFRAMAKNWALCLGFYMAVLGSAGAWLEGDSRAVHELWRGINLWMAFVHYAYDGMIWKLRRPATAHILGADSAATVE